MDYKDEQIEDLAQKLYARDGHAGNLYKSDDDREYEEKAIRLLNRNTAYISDLMREWVNSRRLNTFETVQRIREILKAEYDGRELV